MKFKRWFFPCRSFKSHSQTLCGRRNESRSDWEQEIQEIWCLISSIKSNFPQMLYIVEEHLNLLANLGATVQSAFNSWSTTLMKRIECESLRLSRDLWIFDRPPRWCHVACFINNASNARCWILIGSFRCVMISAVITPLINGWS